VQRTHNATNAPGSRYARTQGTAKSEKRRSTAKINYQSQKPGQKQKQLQLIRPRFFMVDVRLYFAARPKGEAR